LPWISSCLLSVKSKGQEQRLKQAGQVLSLAFDQQRRLKNFPHLTFALDLVKSKGGKPCLMQVFIKQLALSQDQLL
jgi:hypothetical protein